MDMSMGMGMGSGWSPTIDERSPRNEFSLQPERETMPGFYSHQTIQRQGGQCVQDLRDYRADRTYEYANRQRRSLEPRAYGMQEQKAMCSPPSPIGLRQESFVHREAKQGDNNNRRADSPGLDTTEKILKDLRASINVASAIKIVMTVG